LLTGVEGVASLPLLLLLIMLLFPGIPAGAPACPLWPAVAPETASEPVALPEKLGERLNAALTGAGTAPRLGLSVRLVLRAIPLPWGMPVPFALAVEARVKLSPAVVVLSVARVTEPIVTMLDARELALGDREMERTLCWSLLLALLLLEVSPVGEASAAALGVERVMPVCRGNHEARIASSVSPTRSMISRCAWMRSNSDPPSHS